MTRRSFGTGVAFPDCLANGLRMSRKYWPRRMSPWMTHYDYYNYCDDVTSERREE